MSTNAARQHAYWNRVKHGRIVMKVELDEAALLAALGEAGLLVPLDEDNREEVNASAFGGFAADHRRRPARGSPKS